MILMMHEVYLRAETNYFFSLYMNIRSQDAYTRCFDGYVDSVRAIAMRLKIEMPNCINVSVLDGYNDNISSLVDLTRQIGARPTTQIVPLHVYIPPNFPYTSELFLQEHSPRQVQFVQVASREEAGLILRSAGPDVVLEWLAGAILPYQPTCRVYITDIGGPSCLPRFIAHIARFHHLLEYHSLREPIQGVSLEMYWVPGRGQADRSSGDYVNLLDNNRVHLRPGNDGYGLKIRNTSNLDLFPYLFIFNNDDYSIEPLYLAPPGGASLRRNNGEVTIGMDGESRLLFSMPPNMISSYSFLKLFVSAQWLDMGWIAQREGFPARDLLGEQLLVHDEVVPKHVWDIPTVALAMRLEHTTRGSQHYGKFSHGPRGHDP
ncbi:hypothetical protein DFH06DRAFT_523240 [Mycena polygramma]|nr:hypothetical protein DFH06DRAFT_523240 [Mycena polygramma]